jgi:hypothetical protein
MACDNNVVIEGVWGRLGGGVGKFAKDFKVRVSKDATGWVSISTYGSDGKCITYVQLPPDLAEPMVALLSCPDKTALYKSAVMDL